MSIVSFNSQLESINIMRSASQSSRLFLQDQTRICVFSKFTCAECVSVSCLSSLLFSFFTYWDYRISLAALAREIPHAAVKLSGAGFHWKAVKFIMCIRPSCVCYCCPPSLKGLFLFFLFSQGHGSHRYLFGSAPEQDPDQRPGNAVPNATDARPNGSRLRDFKAEKRRKTEKGSKATSFSYEKNT